MTAFSQRYQNVCIEAVSCHLPENVVTSADLEKRLEPVYQRLKLPFGRLEMMSGIRERRFWAKGTFPSEVSAEAGEKVIAKSGIDRQDIQCLIHASVSRDFLEPATATVVHDRLKLSPDALAYDVSNACLGVLTGMVQIANMIEMGQIRAGLVVAGENGGPLVDSTIEALLAEADPTRNQVKAAFASLTIGSAAAAVLLTHKDVSRSGRRFLIGGVSRSDTRFNHLCRGSRDEGVHSTTRPLMETDSEGLLKEGCAVAEVCWKDFRSALGWSNAEVDRCITHQVGVMHRKLLFQTLGLDADKDYATLEFLGNTGAAALPATLALAEENGRLERGHKVALLGIGSGVVCHMLGIEW
jgi:3-oxoacyl-[acyl-carrier-protein] synthase-3